MLSTHFIRIVLGSEKYPYLYSVAFYLDFILIVAVAYARIILFNFLMTA